ncbi:hypothetical protein HID58_042763 [Brassica napus]|uniref:Uncharacterized protein n=1 Tax=Brassica napus TaxID=3708 RepID=A0ABQ8BEJ5_BRANA|nr:hypothetical protein HID58_042763 [Brassica napus]
MARFPLLYFLFAAVLTSSLTSAGDENHVYSPCSDSTARSAMDSFLELPSRWKILSLVPIVPFNPKSMRSPFSPSIPLPVPLVIVQFNLVSLIYNGEFRVLIVDFDLLLIGSKFICPD